ncbi:hypothetical protein CXB51_019326 [Gossypium anomalum]|uniref:Reverse transcriptase Ty1/copia-type domain-containing protein n=1 Tax=Gossypium anomalum TaxID=47600 RepID=A0A8J5ZDB8_9ROSI|nr:hypothetical protein CXB51_019326 [Gossypium anomalum]
MYVDDILLKGNSHGTIENTVEQLYKQFSLKDLGSPVYFLGIKVQSIVNGIFINQKKYTLDLLAQTNMMNSQPTLIPMAVGKKLAKNDDPRESHWVAVKRIFHYLRGTLDHRLVFTTGKIMNLTAYTDADWGSDVDDRRSISGHCVLLGPNIISWSSKKQRFVSRSTAEVKIKSLADKASEIIWL